MIGKLREKLILWLLSFQNGNLLSHCTREIEAAGLNDPERDFYGGMTGQAVTELARLFSMQGHSGMSGSLVLELFARVVSWKPLTPLTGEDWEWIEVSDGVWQNHRCSRVFKENGIAYDSEGIVFCEPSGACFTSRESRVLIEFPYTPTTRYVDRSGEE